MVDIEKAQQIAFQLHKPDFELAFIENNDIVFYSYYEKLSLDFTSSAVITLLQGIFESYVDLSFFILRKRLFTTAPLTERDRGMIKVVAKRATDRIMPQDHGLDLSKLQFKEVRYERSLQADFSLSLKLDADKNWVEKKDIKFSHLEDHEKWDFINKLSQQNPRGPILHDYDRPIAAALWGPQGEFLGSARNSNKLNKTLHAEVNLVQDYYLRNRKKIPAGSRLFSTHKPCRMCAGMIFDNFEKLTGSQVLYLYEEKGSHSRHTILDQLGLNTAWVES